ESPRRYKFCGVKDFCKKENIRKLPNVGIEVIPERCYQCNDTLCNIANANAIVLLSYFAVSIRVLVF
ncbi:hypothetical protein ILUMI_19163, partial [Ignelater luminosus]